MYLDFAVKSINLIYFTNKKVVEKIGSLAFAEGSELCEGAKDNVPMREAFTIIF